MHEHTNQEMEVATENRRGPEGGDENEKENLEPQVQEPTE
jgi:hypothetical protein